MAALITDTTNDLQHPVNAVCETAFLRQATPLCHYFMGTTAGMLKKNGGSATIKWSRINSMTPSTTALSEQTGNAAFFGGRDAIAAARTDATATVAKYGQAVILNEEVLSFGLSQQKVQVYEALGICAGRSANMLQRDVVDDNATVVYAAGAASTGALVSKITRNSIDNVVKTLIKQVARPFTALTKGSSNLGTAPILPAYWGICHPDVAYDIQNLAGFRSVETYAGQIQTAAGEFGLIQGSGYAVRFVQSVDGTADANAGGAVGSTGLVSTGASNIDVYTTAIYGQDALGSVGLGKKHSDGVFTAQGMDSLPEAMEIIEKGLGSAGTGDPFNEISTVSYKFWHAGKVLNTNWVRVIKSGATSLTS